MSASALSYCQSVTVNGGTSKVFIPSKAQYETDWDWPKTSANNRKQTGVTAWYWTSTPYLYNVNRVWRVNSLGNFQDYLANGTDGGFRPAVKVQYQA